MCDCFKDSYIGPIPCPMCQMMEQRQQGVRASLFLITPDSGGKTKMETRRRRMTSEKIIQVLSLYREELSKRGVEAKQLSDYQASAQDLGQELILSHMAYLCEEGIKLVKEGRKEKVFRWLGHIQGVLFMAGIYSIFELKDHSRPQ